MQGSNQHTTLQNEIDIQNNNILHGKMESLHLKTLILLIEQGYSVLWVNQIAYILSQVNAR